MPIQSVLSRSIALAVCSLASSVSLAGAQATAPRLELTERLRLDAAAEDFSAIVLNRQGNSPYYVGPSGSVVLPLPQDGNVRIYDSTGKRLATLGRKGAGPGEFRSIFRLGWTHDTLWVYDAALRRMTYYMMRRSCWMRRATSKRLLASVPPSTSWKPTAGTCGPSTWTPTASRA